MKKWNKKYLLLICALVIVLSAAAGWYFIVVDNIADEVVIEAGYMPLASDYLIRDLGIAAEFESDPTRHDLTVPGVYVVTLRYRNRSYESTLRVRDTVAPAATTRNLSALAPAYPEPEAFITEISDAGPVSVIYQTAPDTTREGDQTVTLILTDQSGNTAEVTALLTVIHDKTAPVISAPDAIRYYVGHELDYLNGVSVTDDLDSDPVLSVDSSAVDLNIPGTYQILYTAVDDTGNQSSAVTSITVIEDFEGPEILGVSNRSLYAGSTISYRSNIIIRDNVDTAPKLTIDSSAVDLSTPGTYPLIYKAVDEAGNETICEITVTVKEPRRNLVDEEKIYAEADRIIAKIIDEDMTPEEQVRTIHKWIQRSFYYAGTTDKTDWKQAAYQMINNMAGDCYGFFSLSKLLFERLGIPNIDVQRLRLPTHGSNHYWNMVSVDGGKTWYHYDSTPFTSVPEKFCLVTDAYLDSFSARYSDYFNRDKSALPATPLTNELTQ